MADATALNARIGRTWERAAVAHAAPASHPPAVRTALWLPFALLLALWPHWRWMAARMVDGSDEPWGVVALVTVLVLLVRERRALQTPARTPLAVAALLAVAAAATLLAAPPLVAAGVAMLALGVLLASHLPRRSAAPLMTLLLLALPLIATLQFYLGFPLRVLTAQLAAPLLGAFGIAAQPMGAALQWQGGTVLVDAPCAGIAMLWLGAYCMALLSWLHDASALRTFGNGCAAAALVFAANVLRNVVLFFPESGHVHWPAWSHDAVGIAAFALAMIPAIAIARARRSIAFAQSRARDDRRVVDTPSPCGAISCATQLSFVGACLLAAVVPAAARVLPVSTTGGLAASAAPVTRSVEWPTHFRDRPLTQLALTPLESRFAARFPGAIARFTDGQQIVIARVVNSPTRLLHPAADCFRAAGYAITPPRAAIDDRQKRWNCFEARGRDGERLRVCERIEDGAGAAWTDVSSWFWSALRSPGPRRAWTVVPPVGLDGAT